MKKLTSLFLSAILIVSLVSCQSASITEFEQYLNDGDYSAALELYESELLGQKSQEDADQVLESLIDSLKKSYIDEKEDYDTVSEALQELEKYNSVKELAASTKDYVYKLCNSRASYAKAEDYMAANDYDSVIPLLYQVVSDDSNYDKAQAMLEEAQTKYRNAILDTCNEYVESGDYASARAVLLDAICIYPEEDQFFDLLTEYENAFVQQTLNKAAEQAKQGDYTGAVQTLELASNTVDSEQFDEKIAEYEGYKPHKLSELKVVDSDDLEQREDAVLDTFGNVYNYADQLKVYANTNAYAIYNVNKQFSKFSGTIACSDETGSEVGCILEIYADDKPVYTSGVITRTTPPIQFDIDITNASLIRIKGTGTKNIASNVYCLIGNATVSK